MKALVTGGAGFIGSNIVRTLLERGHDVVVLDNYVTGHKKNLAPYEDKIKIIEGDIRDKDVVFKCLKDTECVFHLAASVGNKKSIDDPLYDANHNVIGTLNILEGMRELGVQTIVYSSSAGIFGEPQYQPVDEGHPCEPDSPYGATKLCGEKLALSYMKLYGIRAVCLRYFNVYGVNQRYDAYGNVIPIFVSRGREGQDITIFGDGLQTRDFINVEDVALANVLSGEKETVSGTINLGTGEEIEINLLAQWVNECLGGKSSVLHESPRPGDVRHCTASNKKLKNLLGFEPKKINKEMLQTYVTWFLENN